MTQNTETSKPAEIQSIDPAPVAPQSETTVETAEKTEQTTGDTTVQAEAAAPAEVAQGVVEAVKEEVQEVQKAEEPTPAPAPAAVDGVKDESVEQKPAPEPDPAPVTETVEEETKADMSEEAAYLAKVRASGTEGQKKILAAIELYCERFRPRAPVTGEQGVKWQYEFLLHALKLINSEYDVFKAGWNVLLVFFKEHHGRSSVSNTSPISDGPASRFGPYWERGDETWAAYKNIFELLRATRDPATRKMNVKNIVMERVGPGLITEDGLRNLRRFYQ